MLHSDASFATDDGDGDDVDVSRVTVALDLVAEAVGLVERQPSEVDIRQRQD